MEEKLKRRDFMGRLSVGLFSLMALPYKGIAKSFEKEPEQNSTAMTTIDPILKIKTNPYFPSLGES